MVKNQPFREDLWVRINVFPIWIPPFRQRKVDIPSMEEKVNPDHPVKRYTLWLSEFIAIDTLTFFA